VKKDTKLSQKKEKVPENAGLDKSTAESGPSTVKSEPKNTGRFGKGNPGKPKGALSKTTKSAKEAIAAAAETLGGAERLAKWASEDPANERVFWGTIYPKLLPLQVTGEGGGPVIIQASALDERI
jgi:hypothetical protein